MTELLKEDIPVLDFIIDKLCEKGKLSYITAKYLGDKKIFGFGRKDTVGDFYLNETDNNEFERLASIINNSGKAKINKPGFNSSLSISRNGDTLQFKELGGFANEFKKQNNKKRYNEPWVGFLITFTAIILGCFQYYQNNKLKERITNLENIIYPAYENKKHGCLENKLFDSKKHLKKEN